MSKVESLNVLIPIFTNFNTLDVNGPLDVLCNYQLRGDVDPNPLPFVITTCAYGKDRRTGIDSTLEVKAYEGIIARANISFAEARSRIKQGDFDVLMVPGCGPGETSQLLKGPVDLEIKSLLETLTCFYENDNRASQKWMISICVGAMFMGAMGAFKGLDATTHWAALSTLETICTKNKVTAKSVTKERFIDAGPVPPVAPAQKQTRILSSGGISCGLDCALYLVSQVYGAHGKETAEAVAKMMDYRWRTTETD